jgi:hypothetical protein
MKSSRPLRNALLGISLVVFFIVNSVQGQTNFTTHLFNTNFGYERGYGIISTAQPESVRWQGNDSYNESTGLGETDLVERAVGYTPAPAANSSLIQGGLGASAGILPGTNNVQIWKTFNAYSNYAVVSFMTEWALIASSATEAPYTNSDTFSYSLMNDAGASLLELQFTPGINILPNSYTLQTFATGQATQTPIDLGYNSLFQMQVDITGSTYELSLSRLDPSTRTVITNYSNLVSGYLSTGYTSDNFSRVGINWTLSSGDNEKPGSNYIIVNNVAAVPEPTTYAFLVCTLLLGFLIRRRLGRA